MRILLIEMRLSDDGALRVSLDRARRWQRDGVHVTVLVLSHRLNAGDHAYAVPDDLTLQFVTVGPERLRKWIPLAIRTLVRLVRRADVVVAGREIDFGLLLGAAAAWVFRRPFAVTVQSDVEMALESYIAPRLRRPTILALQSAAAVVCVSAGLGPRLLAVGIARDRINVVLNGVDIESIGAAAEQMPLVALPEGPFIVGSGRLTRQKGFDILIRAHAAALASGAPPHSLVIVGEGPDRPELEYLAAALGVANTVRLLGFVENPHAIVGRAHLFAFPSRWEGFGLVLVEALCVGTPVIATDCTSGPREILGDDLFGQLIPVDDVVALADGIKAHLEDPEPLQTRADRSGPTMRARFEAAGAARRHLEVLAGLTRARDRRPSSRLF